MKHELQSHRAFHVAAFVLLSLSVLAPAAAQDQGRYEEFLSFSLDAGGRGMVLPDKLSRAIERADRSPLLGPAMRHGLASEFGIILHKDRLIGLVAREDAGVRWNSFGCAVCHAGKAAGRFIPGLGNKNFDLHAGGKMLLEYHRIEKADDALSRASRVFAEIVGDDAYGNTTQGIVNAALVWPRILPAMEGSPAPPAFVKIPAVWGMAAKSEAGYFADGFGRGLGWYGATSWVAGQTTEVLTAGIDELRRIESIFESFEAPAYPFAVSPALAAEGAPMYREHCMECHGEHHRDGAGKPVHEPAKWIALERVGTDESRLQFPEGFLESIDHTSMGGLLQRTEREPGYLAPRLTGIWARFPYLHNGSVPSLAALLTPPEERPTWFSVADAGELHRFDESKVGLSGTDGFPSEPGVRTIYRTSDPGHSNAGHDFGTDLAAEEKAALIEYLKTF